MRQERILGARSLQGDQGPIRKHVDLTIVRDVRTQVREIVVLRRGIDGDEEMGPQVGDHDVIHDAAGDVRQDGVALAPNPELDEIGGYKSLQRKSQLAHGS